MKIFASLEKTGKDCHLLFSDDKGKRKSDTTDTFPAWNCCFICIHLKVDSADDSIFSVVSFKVFCIYVA